MKNPIENYAQFVNEVCEKNGWDKGWSAGGCYMHLEVSEFIEAVRGKGSPVEELGDVLFTVVAVANNYNIDIMEALHNSVKKHSQEIQQ